MHIVIGVLTALAGLIWALAALRKSGFNFSALDPFALYRRFQWNKKYSEKAIYSLNDPLDVAGLLLLGVTKCEGEISSEQKKELLRIFESEFKLNDNDASDLLLASSHLIRDEVYLVDNINKIMNRSKSNFSKNQIESLVKLMGSLANFESVANTEQNKLIQATQTFFNKYTGNENSWGSE